MKNIWIYDSLDGIIAFSNPKKAFDYAGVSYECTYSTYLHHLRQFGVYQFKHNEDLNIRKIEVK